MTRVSIRNLVLTPIVLAILRATAFAQSPQLVFTATVPVTPPSGVTLSSSPAIEERGLALWAGTASDFGVGVAVTDSHWTVRTNTSMRTLPFEGRDRPTFEQVEILRQLPAQRAMSAAAGGGIRQEWDGTRVLVGRVIARTALAHGAVQGSLVMERAFSSPIRRDGADLVTSVGWSRRVSARFSAGVEAIGQDLEGFWDPAEADGGAKLLVGPSVHAQTASGRWSATVTAGPVLHTPSTTLAPGSPPGSDGSSGRHFGIFASGSWMPAFRRSP
jgi:hypothetical protein